MMLAEVAFFNTIKRRLQSQRPHDHRLEAALPQIQARRAGQVTLHAVEFETVFFPEPMHRVFADTERGRQFGASPMGGTVAGFPAGGRQESGSAKLRTNDSLRQATSFLFRIDPPPGSANPVAPADRAGHGK
jgi:hypothetical protein